MPPYPGEVRVFDAVALGVLHGEKADDDLGDGLASGSE